VKDPSAKEHEMRNANRRKAQTEDNREKPREDKTRKCEKRRKWNQYEDEENKDSEGTRMWYE
jgi:hypothetical protein